jgi:hypothetical protein
MSDASEKDLLPAIDMDLIQRQMRHRDSLVWSRVGMKLAAGVPLSLAGPLALSLVLFFDGWLNDWRWNYFTLWFALACAAWALVAWKFLPRVQPGGYFADEAMRIVSLTPENVSDPALSELNTQEPKAVARFILARALAGPKYLYEAWHLAQEHKTFGESRMQRAAQVVAELSRRQKSIRWVKLRLENESLPELLTTLGYLKVTDWVDFGTDGSRIWLRSDARKATMAGT